MALDSTRRGRVRELCATNVPCDTEQNQRFLRAGAPAVSVLSTHWMKTQFNLPRKGSAQGRPQSDPLAGNSTARHPLTLIASTFQLQVLFGQGPRKERGTGCPAVPTAHVPGSAT